MRRPFIAGNWKMNLDLASSVALVEGLVQETADCDDVDVAVCPPSVYLSAVAQAASLVRRSAWERRTCTTSRAARSRVS